MFYGKNKFNIAFIGAGSCSFTSSLVGDILSENYIEGGELRLVDLYEPDLNLAYLAVNVMVADAQKDFKVSKHTDYRTCLQDLDFIIFTFVTGRYESWKRDIEISTKHGVLQSVGDTIGPGGIIRAIRNVPIVYEIAKEMEQVCPNAWAINYTNPEGAMCLALQQYTKIRSFGLCHGTPDTVNQIAQNVYGLDKGSLSYRAAGINHITWITELIHNGKDLYPTLKSDMIKAGFNKEEPISFELFERFGLYPAPGDRHVSEFFPYYLKDKVLNEKNYTWKNNDFVRVEEWRNHGQNKFEKLSKGDITYKEYGTSGETATHFIKALAGDGHAREMANVINKGHIENVSDGIVVEVPVHIDQFGLHPENVGKLPAGIAAKCESLGREYQLLVEAALTCDKNLALQAMMLDPIVANCYYPEALLDELLLEYKGVISDKWFT